MAKTGFDAKSRKCEKSHGGMKKSKQDDWFVSPTTDGATGIR